MYSLKCINNGTHTPKFSLSLQLILESGVRVVVVATKADKLSKGEAVELPKRVRNWLSPILEAAYAIEEANERDSTDRWPVVPFSATTGQGRAQLWNAIRHNILADE